LFCVAPPALEIISHLTHGAAVGYPVGAPLALGYVSAIGSCVESIYEMTSGKNQRIAQRF
jgi:hypothetical protein